MGLAFRIVPLGCLLAAATLALALGPGWSMRSAAVPWLVAIVAVGLPHGAADLAIARKLCGWDTTWRLFVGYLVLMAATLAALCLMPRVVVVLFAALSIWHFGESHARRQSPASGAAWPWRVAATLARGASVLGVPVAAWPERTTEVVGQLVSLVGRPDVGAGGVFAPESIRMWGVVATVVAALALAGETAAFHRTPGVLRRSCDTLVDLSVIGLLGMAADPLFSMGLYFLCWHAWGEMLTLMEVLTPKSAEAGLKRGIAAVLRDLAAVHHAALPLLIPTWIALAAAWWILSSTRSPRDLAIASLVVYVMVTPAHEALHEFLQTGFVLRTTAASSPGLRPSRSSTFRQTVPPCTVRSASS